MEKDKSSVGGADSRSNSSNSQGSHLLQKHQTKLKWILASADDAKHADAGAGSSSTYCTTPQIKNHTATLYKKKLYVFGGYDGKKNHS